MKYKVTKKSYNKVCSEYAGYIDGEYAGHVYGYALNSKTFDIQGSALEPEFRGTKRVRALQQIIAAVLRDYRQCISRIDNKDNAEIKMVLSAGFHIIGTRTYKDTISVELIKTREVA